MSADRRWSPEQIRLLIEAFDNPMLVARRSIIEMVNEAYLRGRGWAREEVEGRDWRDMLPPERLAMGTVYEEMRQMGSLPGGPSFPVVAKAKDGRAVREQAQVQMLKASDGGEDFVLANMLLLGGPPHEMEQFGVLADIALPLSGARSEDEVRALVVGGFSRVGFTARFYRANRAVPSPESGSELRPEPGHLRQALEVGGPVFAGHAARSGTAYLPLGEGPDAEVLLVAGGTFSLEHLPVWGLFARQVASALGSARLISDLRRRNRELSAVAELARLTSNPSAPTSEPLLRVAEAVGADAVLLHAGGEGGQHPLEGAYGLDDEERLLFEARPIWMSVSEQAPDEALATATAGRFVAGASVQLRKGKTARGVLTVLRRHPATFDAGAVRLLGTLGDLLLTFLEQRRLREASDRKLEESRNLLELARVAAGTLEPEELLKAACEALSRLLGMSICHISLFENDPPRLVGAATNGPMEKFFHHVTVTLDTPGITTQAVRERRTVVVRDGVRERAALSPDFVESLGPRACVAIPLVSREELIGAVSLTDERALRDFTPEWMDFAHAAVGQIALAIANSRLYASLKRSFGELEKSRRENVKQERLAALGELSAVVAHEVRNPLGVIFNAVSSLRRLISPRGDAQVLIEILAEESDRLNRMVGELLDFARPSTLSFQPEDVETVIHEALYAASSQYPSEAFRFEVDVAPRMPPLRMDRRMFRQAFVNVAVNAMQAMPRGGALKVKVRAVARGGRSFAQVQVSDRGPGIPSDVALRIFEPFFTTKAQGTGLGLAVVQRIVEDHQGEVEVTPRSGGGTTFTFHFPFEPGANE